MHILLFHQYYLEPDGAGGTRFNEMSTLWTNDGHKVTVIAGMMPDQTGKKKNEYKGKYFVKNEQSGVTVIRCHVSEGYNKNFLGRILGYFTFTFYSLIAGIFKTKDKYDIVLVTSPPLFIGISGYLTSIFKKVPFVFEVRDLWPESAADTGVVKNEFILSIARFLERFIYRKAKLINVLTPAFRTNLIEKKKVPQTKICYIPNAADIAAVDSAMNSFKPGRLRTVLDCNDKFVIIYVGAHGLANGLHQILAAAELLKDTNVIFWLIGKGMKKSELINSAKQRKINNVLFLDPVPKSEIYHYILDADLGTSVLIKNDTFKTIYSNKTFDYMSCKKPILLAIDGVSRELVETADCGLFVIPENPDDFVEKVKTYINKPELISIHGENGYNFVAKYFDRRILAKEYIKNLSNLLT